MKVEGSMGLNDVTSEWSWHNDMTDMLNVIMF